jgi:GTP-binding protein Era
MSETIDNQTLGLDADFRCGVVAIVGRPNVGKSTLLNRILGEKIAIASPRPQTTRDNILGVKHLPGAQIVFVDTPGIHKPKGPLNKAIVATALSALRGVDLALLVVDVDKQVKRGPGMGRADERILAVVQQAECPMVLALNKVDLSKKHLLLPIMETWHQTNAFKVIIPISARTGDGVDALVEEIAQRMEPGPALYPDDMVTDRSMRFLASELIREKLFLQLNRELPYAVAVEVETWAEEENHTHIRAVIHIEKESQKRIAVGAGGSRVKAIGIAARQDLEQFLGRKVHLELFVHVQPRWSQTPVQLKRFGYEGEGGEGG